MDPFPLLGADLLGYILGFPAYVDIHALGKQIQEKRKPLNHFFSWAMLRGETRENGDCQGPLRVAWARSEDLHKACW